MTRASLLIVPFLGLSACQDAESLRVDCADGDAITCYELRVMYQSGEGAALDFAGAASLYEQACDGGDMPGCLNLGFMYATGEGVTEDLARAASLRQQACDGGEVETGIRG